MLGIRSVSVTVFFPLEIIFKHNLLPKGKGVKTENKNVYNSGFNEFNFIRVFNQFETIRWKSSIYLVAKIRL